MTKGPKQADVQLKTGTWHFSVEVTVFFDLGVVHIKEHGVEKTLSFDKIAAIEWSRE